VAQHSCDVVIATKDRPEVLRRCLQGLVNQSMRDFGVIVVDDGSATPAAEVVDQFPSLDATVVELHPSRGPAAARNAGVERCSAPFVVFVDDDVVADRYFIEVHLERVRQGGAGRPPVVSCGPFVQPADWDPTPWNLWEARQAKKEADSILRGAYDVTWRQFHTGNNCVPVDVFRAVGGFDPDFKRAEDDEFALRLKDHGCTFVFEPRAIAWHYSNRSLEAWLSIPRAYARFDVEIDRLHPHEGYLRQKQRELRRRKLPMRAVRLACRSRAGTDIGVRAAVGLGAALYRFGAVGASMSALSVAYDLSYVRSLRESMVERRTPVEDRPPC
jgi:GT2 family glycosyltransferase